MQVCTACNTENQDTSRFCSRCGERLNNLCEACGFRNLIDQKFCGQCGKQLLPDRPAGGPAHTEPPGAAWPDSGGSTRFRAATQRLRAVKHKGATTPIEEPPADTRLEPEPPTLPATQATETPAAVLPVETPAPLPTPEPEPLVEPMLLPVSEAEATVATEENVFANLEELDDYALLSIEFANFPQLVSATDNQRLIERFRRDCFAFVEERVIAANGLVESSKNNVIFVSFRREPSLEHSVLRAVAESLRLLGESFSLQDIPLKLRIGLDIENSRSKMPMTASTERTIAKPGTLVVSERVFQLLQDLYKTEAIGPLPVGSRMTTFYQVIKPAAPRVMPSSEALLASNEAEPIPEPLGPVAEPAFEPEPTPETALEAGPGTEAEPESEWGIAAAETPQPLPLDEAPTVQAAARKTPPQPPVPEPREEAEEEATGLVHYEPPIYSLTKATRPSNTNYEKAVEALYSELQAFITAGGHGQGKILSLSAAEGLGKSNILNIARMRSDPDNQNAYWLIANNYRSLGANQLPLLYWVELLQNLLGLILEGQPEAEVREILSQFLRQVYDGELPEDSFTLFFELLSANRLPPLEVEDREKIGLIAHCFRELLGELARKRPLVLVVEDMNYADPASLELLSELLAGGLLEKSVCLIVSHARDFHASGALATQLQKGPYKELVVANLEDNEAERFMNDGPLGGNISAIPFEITDEILRKAKGLPLHLEESLRLLHLQGMLGIHPESGKFIAAPDAPLHTVRLPETPENLSALRLDYLSDVSRYLLQLAAVIGEKFPVSLLLGLSQMEEDIFNETLTLLYDHGYLVPDVVNTGRFRHGLLWQATYNSLDPELRQKLHQLISETLENDFKAGITVYPALIAHHAENGNLLNRAFNYWNLAGIQGAHVGSLAAMNLSLFRALDILREAQDADEATLEIRIRLQENLGIFNLEENPDLALQLLQWVSQHQQQGDDNAKLVETLGFLATCYEGKGNYTQALKTLEQVLAHIPAEHYPAEHAAVLINKMEYLYTLGRLQQGLDLMTQEIEPITHRLSSAEHPDYFDAYLNARLLKARILIIQCSDAVFPILEETLHLAQERGLESLALALQLARAEAFLRKGQYESCDREADGLLGQIEALEDPDWFLGQWGLLAIAYHCDMGDFESARQLLLTVITKAESSKDHLTWLLAQTYAGRIAYGLGNYPEAKRLLEQAIELSSDYKCAGSALAGWRFLAEAELALGSHEVAREIAERALEIAEKPEIRNLYEAYQLTNLYANCLIVCGEIKPAGKMLESLWPQVIQSKYSPLIAQTAFWIGELYKSLAQDAPSELSKKHLEGSLQFFDKSKTLWQEMKNRYQSQRIEEARPKL